MNLKEYLGEISTDSVSDAAATGNGIACLRFADGTAQEMNTEFLLYLKLLNVAPVDDYVGFYSRGVENHGFYDSSGCADIVLQVLEWFSTKGVVSIDKPPHSGIYGPVRIIGIPERANGSRFSLKEKGLESTVVESVVPRCDAEGFYSLFPRV